MRDANVAENLLALSLAGTQPDMPRLAAAFAALDFDRSILTLSFERCLIAYHRALTAALVADTIRMGSPLYRQVSLGRALAIQALLENQQRNLAAITELVPRLEAAGGQTIYNIVIGEATGVAIGDQAQVNQALPADLAGILQEILTAIRHNDRGGHDLGSDLRELAHKFAERTQENLPLVIPGIRGAHFTHPQLDQVNGCLESYGAVLLTGGPGAGKSDIAIDIVRDAVGNGRNVLFIDARQVAHLSTPRNLQELLDLDRSVADTIAQLAEAQGCLLVLDQVDSVAGTPAARLLLNSARNAASCRGAADCCCDAG